MKIYNDAHALVVMAMIIGWVCGIAENFLHWYNGWLLAGSICIPPISWVKLAYELMK